MPQALEDHVSSSSQFVSISHVPKASQRYITRKFLAMPEGTQWSSGAPSIVHWPMDSQHVFVSLEDSKRWARVTFPQPFPPDSVEFHVAKAFRSISGSFFKHTKKRIGVGKD